MSYQERSKYVCLKSRAKVFEKVVKIGTKQVVSDLPNGSDLGSSI